MNPIDLLPRTPITCTQWNREDGLRINVYTQDLYGNIRESRFHNGWNGGTDKDIIVRDAKPSTPMSVINWEDNIRLYYVDKENKLREMCWTKGKNWWVGGLQQSNIQVLPASQLAAVWLNPGINVYYQRPDRVIQEVRWMPNRDWFQDKTLARAIVGTSFAVTPVGNRGLRLYFQLPDCHLGEECYDQGRGWYRGGFKFKAPATASLSCISFHGASQIRVYTISQDGMLQEYQFTNNSWHGPSNLSQTIPASFNGSVVEHEGKSIRVYRQANSNELLEEHFMNNKWQTGAVIPTGNVQGN